MVLLVVLFLFMFFGFLKWLWGGLSCFVRKTKDMVENISTSDALVVFWCLRVAGRHRLLVCVVA